ncbi:two-component system LytT family sensor kinase [Marisediminicola sp. UYEF4]|uniref:sensor histidine kinase n=1 Tax=Marisediminicola sp. UYEF4 TaxID=1756384 RepID=UPI00339ABE01
MNESTLIALLSGSAIGAVLTLGVLLAWRYARGSRELGSDGEHATYRTLHLASQAAENLRGGLDADEVSRAARHLRALLGCDILAIADAGGSIVIDGPGEPLREVAASIAERMSEASRTQVVSVPAASGRDSTYAIAAPIVTDGHVAGMVIVFAPSRRAPLIRATGEVAAWVSAQLRLGELDASRAALAEAELRALRAQISPHFIYNALNAIASFITTDPSKARELVLEFADFTRYSFRRHGDFTTLAEELRSIHSYLLLERARFGDRLEVTLQIAPETLSTVIPFLSLQPLVENSVRHGLERKEGGGRITISAEAAGMNVQITVEDDGAGVDPDAVEALLSGSGGADHIGLRNVDSRMRQVYGDAYGLVVETNLGAGTLVRLLVPQSQPMNDTDTVEANADDRLRMPDRSGS